MERAGLPAQTIIGPEVVREIHFRAQGIPRLINAFCDNLLFNGLRHGEQDGHHLHA
jgi:type II secretory pathway predicted ATPase ExeA